MTGAHIKVTADTRALDRALKRLEAKGGDAMMQAALKNVGEVILNATRARFGSQTGPDGKPWAPLDPRYKGTDADRATKGKKKGQVITKGVKKGPKILTESGQLFASLRYQVSGNVLQVGTNKIYGAIHQFGGVIRPRSADALTFWLGGKLVHFKKVTIPARPFLGLSAHDRERALEAVKEVWQDGWSGAP